MNFQEQVDLHYRVVHVEKQRAKDEDVYRESRCLNRLSSEVLAMICKPCYAEMHLNARIKNKQVILRSSEDDCRQT